MGLYQQTDYRKALRDILDEKKRLDPSISFSSYADVIGVQKTFVSKVLGGNAHLSDDQLYLTLEFLKLTQDEANYFRLLYDHSRTGLHSRKKIISAEIKKRQEEQRQLKIHTDAEIKKPESAEDFGEYYLDPLNLIVHAHLGVAKYALNPLLIAESLGISKNQLLRILERLNSLGIIEYNKLGSAVNVLKYALHLDVNSVYCQPHQQLFRLRSAEQIARLSPEKRFVYSLTFSGDEEVKNTIQELYLDFMKKVENYLDSGDTGEDVFQINFDLFPWAKKD